ncbi:ferritin family protein [Salinimicrobium xinjiangense]|uniref:DUF2383 domain-containing protein n=1 Tax=Salinimicrobium xinjiangense TaxID=438596 RepID=UPI00041A3DBA|nr:DUF2383 domain-containing protein [Salinimicrobium xinjiangense]
MNSQDIKELILMKLIEDNFEMSKHCRKSAEKLTDTSLKHYYQNLASRRSRFAVELADEIAFYNGKKPYIPSKLYKRDREEFEPEAQRKIISKTLKLNKKDLQSYHEALCRIHLGSFREILIRHKAFIENSIFELKSIKKLLKYQYQQNGEFKQERSHG